MFALFGKCSSSLLWNLTYRNDLACAKPYFYTGSTAHAMVSIPSQKDFHGTLFHVAFHGPSRIFLQYSKCELLHWASRIMFFVEGVLHLRKYFTKIKKILFDKLKIWKCHFVLTFVN